MDYQGFIATIEEKAHVSSEEAERAACVTLHTLSHRITRGEAEDLAERLPDKLRSCLTPEGTPEMFDVDGFIDRLVETLGVDRKTAEAEAKAVFAALWRTVGADEFSDMRAQLPKGFYPLLDEAVAQAPPPPEPEFQGRLTLDEMIDRVAERAGIDRDRARTAIEAVLEALTVRITAGQAEDLVPYLPPELRKAIERGIARGGRAARPLPVDAFLELVADLEGGTRQDAATHARAVFSVLREALPDKEFHDTVDQLAGEYRILLKQG
jgi:uncharacterized protein (DUF2267 family)